MAEEVGATYGRAMAAGLTGDGARRRSALVALGDAGRRRRAHRPRLRRPQAAAPGERTDDGLRIINDHCPFGDVAIDHPVICAVDRGMVRGMLGALYADGIELAVATESSKAHGRHVLRHRRLTGFRPRSLPEGAKPDRTDQLVPSGFVGVAVRPWGGPWAAASAGDRPPAAPRDG